VLRDADCEAGFRPTRDEDATDRVLPLGADKRHRGRSCSRDYEVFPRPARETWRPVHHGSRHHWKTAAEGNIATDRLQNLFLHENNVTVTLTLTKLKS